MGLQFWRRWAGVHGASGRKAGQATGSRRFPRRGIRIPRQFSGCSTSFDGTRERSRKLARTREDSRMLAKSGLLQSFTPIVQPLWAPGWVRRERHERKLSQEELADRARLSARYLGSIERATVSAGVTVLGRLAQALRIDPCELIRSPQRR